METIYNILPIISDNNVTLAGLNSEAFALYVVSLLKKEKKPILIVTSSLYEANQIFNNVEAYTDNVYLFPMDEFLTSEAIAVSPDLLITRLETLTKIESSPQIVITNLMGYLRFMPSVSEYHRHFLKLNVGMKIERKELLEKFYSMGYKREVMVTKTGEIGVRGFIIDVFPLGEENPLRLVFFDDKIEEIKYFDSESQKSLNKIDEVIINPCTDFLTSSEVEEGENKQKYLPKYEKKVVSILSYLGDSITIFKDYNDLKDSYNLLCNQIVEYQNQDTFKEKYMFSFDEIKPKKVQCYLSLSTKQLKQKDTKEIDFSVKGVPLFMENVPLLLKYLKECLMNGKTIILCLKDYQSHALQKELKIMMKITTENKIYENAINIISLPLQEGFAYKNIIFLSQKELFKDVIVTKK
ncbi:MAG: hypothetical protein RSE56_03780, partial [Bacilli bacterium]